MTSTPERSASPVSRTVTPLVRPDNSHVTVDSPVLLSEIVGSQKSSRNGDGFTVVNRKKQRQSMVVGTNKNSSISSNKKCYIFVTRVSTNIEDHIILRREISDPVKSPVGQSPMVKIHMVKGPVGQKPNGQKPQWSKAPLSKQTNI